MSRKGRIFAPDWCIRPGVTVADAMEVKELDVAATAALCRLPPATVEGVLRGDPMTAETARALGAGFGIAAGFWERLEAGYRDGLARGLTDVSDG